MSSTVVFQRRRIAFCLLTVISAVVVLTAGPAIARQLTETAISDADQLDVQRWARDPDLRGDKQLADRVRSAFQRNSILGSTQFEVKVRNGVVDLFGTLESYAKKNTAQDLASGTNGVVAVNNNLIVY